MRSRNMLFAAAALAMIVTASPSFAGVDGFPSAPPMQTLTCYHVDGSSESTSIDTAFAHDGGILYTSGVGTSVTTLPCIAHLPPGSKFYSPSIRTAWHIEATDDAVPMHCNSVSGELVYYNVVDIAILSSGVWTWQEESSGDVYVSTAPCTVGGVE